MLAERLRASRIVALDPDVHAQLAAAFFLTGGKMELADSGTGSVSPAHSLNNATRLPCTIYPSLHVATNWERISHRIAPVSVPDAPLTALRRVEVSSTPTFAPSARHGQRFTLTPTATPSVALIRRAPM